MVSNYFYSIEQRRTTNIKIRRSVFICTMEYVQSIGDAKQFISKVAKENKTATHNCWAYITGEQGDIFHCSDAGEPSGTAGKPMLNALKSNNMTNIAVVVTRHFGGVKLGVRGLIDAYFLSVNNTIDLNKLNKLVHSVKVSIEISYEFNDIFLNKFNNLIIGIENTDYSDKIVHIVEIEHNRIKKVEKLLSEYQSRGMFNFSFIED